MGIKWSAFFPDPEKHVLPKNQPRSDGWFVEEEHYMRGTIIKMQRTVQPTVEDMLGTGWDGMNPPRAWVNWFLYLKGRQ